MLLISVNLFYLCSFVTKFYWRNLRTFFHHCFAFRRYVGPTFWGFQTGAVLYFLEVHFLGWTVWKAAVWPNIRVLSVPLCTQSPPVYLFLGWIVGKAASGGEMHLCSGSCRVKSLEFFDQNFSDQRLILAVTEGAFLLNSSPLLQRLPLSCLDVTEGSLLLTCCNLV